jgi:hypothetical protein
MRPPAPAPSVEAPAAPLSRHSLSEQAIAVLREPQSDAEGAQAFLEPLIDAYVERFARYPFDIREIVLKDLALRDHPSAEIRHLVSSLEASYEAHHHKPVHGIETTLVRVFQQAAQEPERIPGLIEQLRRHYRTTTGKEAIDLDREMLEQTRNGELDQEAMESTISAMAQVYEQRFGQQVPGTGGVEADVVRGVLRELVTQQRNMVSGLETLLDRLESR